MSTAPTRAPVSAQHTPGPWMVFSFLARSRLRYVVKRSTPSGAEYINSPNGNPRLYPSVKAARAAIAKATEP